MLCPICKKTKLDKSILSGVEVDYCPKCLGLWFEEEELRLAKDYKDRNLRWLDIDLWKDEEKFRLSLGQKLCPTDRLPLYETGYPDSIEDPRPRPQSGRDGDSDIKVDVCSICKGTWLDRGEFKKIIQYLKDRADNEVLNNYLKNLREELWEIFQGPEDFKDEVGDFLAILKLFAYKFTAQHPAISKIISGLPK